MRPQIQSFSLSAPALKYTYLEPINGPLTMCKRLAVSHTNVVIRWKLIFERKTGKIENPDIFPATVPHRNTQGVRPQGKRGCGRAAAGCVCPGHV
jgi:hypothetical protein